MKPTTGITLPASFLVAVLPACTEVVPTSPAENDILTVVVMRDAKRAEVLGGSA